MNQNERTDRELNFLVYKYLSKPEFAAARHAFLQVLLRNPAALPEASYLGEQRTDLNIQHLERQLAHIGPDHLSRVLGSALSAVQRGPAPGFTSTLGHSSYALPSLLSSLDRPIPPAPLKERKNILLHLSDRSEGRNRVAQVIATEATTKPALIARIWGHLAPVYCIVTDHKGTIAVTGADDALVKIWSLDRYLLLATLRGHTREISDLAINRDDTLLASGSCDKEIRIWCLQTSRNLTVLLGHRKTITFLQFSPNNDYLATCANDNLVHFWPITDDKTVSDDPITFCERVLTQDKLLCSSFSAGGAVFAVGSGTGDIFTYTLQGELGLPVKGDTLEGHTSMVISIIFAKRSLRLLSGCKDGTVRIWTRVGGAWEQVVCSARDQPIVPDRDSKEQVIVNFVQWSVDEGRVIASCSDTSIRMWNLRGELVQTFLGHHDDSYFIQEHPRVPDVLATGGHDGQIIMWSMSTGQPIHTFLNVIENEGRAAFLEATFTPDGQTLLTADGNGYLTVFGHDLMREYFKEIVPRDQFFCTDYHSIISDRFRNVIDEVTELPPHMLGPPYMVDHDGMALPPEVQALIPGRHVLTPAEIIERNRREKAKRRLNYIKRLFSRTSTNQRPRAVSGSDRPIPANTNPELVDFQRSFVVATHVDNPTEELEYIAPVVPPLSNYDLNDGLLANSIANIDRKKSLELWLNRHITTPLAPCPDRTARLERDRQSELVLLSERVATSTTTTETTRSTRKGKGPAPVRNTRSNTQQNIPTPPVSEDEPDTSSAEENPDSSDVDWQISESRKKRRAPAPVTDEEEEEEEEEENEPATPDQNMTERSTNLSSILRSSSSSGEESVGSSPNNNGAISSSEEKSTEDPTTPTPTPKRKRRRVKKSSDDEERDPLEGAAHRVAASSKRKKKIIAMLKKSSSSNKARASSCPRSSEKNKARASSCPRSSEKKKAAPRRAYPREPAKWVTQITPARSPYLPQVSDLVYYFVQGHMEYLASEHCHPDVRDKGRPWEDRVDGSPGVRAVERCRVLSLWFSTGPPTLCQVKLGILGEDDEVIRTFSFRYHDAPNVPDFMILKKHFEDSQSRRWLKGDKFRSLIDEVWWDGVILYTGPVNDAFPGSPWKRIVVQWDTEPVRERLSAWDIEPLARDSRSNKRRSPTKKRTSEPEEGGSGRSFQFGVQEGGEGAGSPLDPFIMGYYHSFGSWGEETREEFTERFGTGVIEVMEKAGSREFLYPVNINDHPDYYSIVAYPVDLTTLHNRLLEQHFRSLKSVLWEVEQLERNARVYNEDDSDIVRNATLITTRLLLFARNPALVSATRDVTDAMVAAEIASKSETKERKRRLRCRAENKTPWFDRASEILELLVGHPNSYPFKYPVDLTIFNDYLKYCREPMDLETIGDKLHGGSYEDEGEFYTDIDLIFNNSFSYNTRKSTTIYQMTVKFQNYYHSLIDRLGEEPVVGRSGSKSSRKSSSSSSSSACGSTERTATQSEGGESEVPGGGVSFLSGDEGAAEVSRNGADSDNDDEENDEEEEEEEEEEEVLLAQGSRRSKRKRVYTSSASSASSDQDTDSRKENRSRRIIRRRNGRAPSPHNSSESESSEASSSEGGSDEEENGRRTRSGRQNGAKLPRKTKRGRIIKKNVRYDEFF